VNVIVIRPSIRSIIVTLTDKQTFSDLVERFEQHEEDAEDDAFSSSAVCFAYCWSH